MEYPLPASTVRAFRQQQGSKNQNPSLLFERFLPDLSRSEDKEIKRRTIQTIIDASLSADSLLFEAWQKRWLTSVRTTKAKPFSMTSEWRVVAGLGRKGPLEVGFTFHRYGFPFLPGSSIKGIARSYAYLIEDRREGDIEFDAIFGKAADNKDTASQAGQAIFYDAIPWEVPTLEMDVMTPHFPDYYQGGKPPTDSQNPNPINFLTVASGTPFLFAVGWRGALDEEAHGLQALAEEWLRGGLEVLGAGAKTSAGYGYFGSMKRVEIATGAVEEFTEPSVDLEEILVEQYLQGIEAIPHNKVPSELNRFYQLWLNINNPLLKQRLAEAIRDKGHGKVSKKAKEEGGWYHKIVESLES